MTRAAVVGGGVAGLVTAWELARAGAEVDLYEAGAQLGGALAPVELAGIGFDAGAEAFASRSAAVAQLIDELGLEGRVISPNPVGAWLQLPELAAPLPATGLLGIPASPEGADVVTILGKEAARRAGDDFIAPMRWSTALKPGNRPSLGEVVRGRMGTAVVDRLVSPITSGVYSATPDDVAIDAVHPSLYETMVAHGSLGRAVASLKAAAPAGSAVQSLQGGMHTLIEALQAQLYAMGVSIRLNTPVHALNQIEAEHIVLALGEEQAAGLASPYLSRFGVTPPAEQGATSAGVALATLLLHAPELDAHPRGTGMLVAPSVTDIAAKAMTHISAKWQWVANRVRDELGQGYHAVRLSYGRVTDDPTADSVGFRSSDEQVLQAALADVPELTGLPITPEQVRDTAVVRWQQAVPAASAAHRHRAAEFREALAAARAQSDALAEAGQRGPTTARIWATGAWISGTGLAQVIPDARQTAQQLLDT